MRASGQRIDLRLVMVQPAVYVLNSKVDGPLMPAFETQTIGNAVSWGLVNDAPNSLVWEIGRRPFCTYPWYAFNGTANAFTFGGD